LLGQPLVAQLATPVGPDVLASLYESSWGVAPVLDFATSFLTLDYDEFYAALNAIAELDSNNVLELVAAKSSVTKTKDSTTSETLSTAGTKNIILEVTNKAAGTGADDALVLYFLPYHPHSPHRDTALNRREKELWNRLLGLYARTQSAKCPLIPGHSVDPDKLPSCRSIELRTMPILSSKTSASFSSGAPLMKTYSALGILKNAAEQPNPKIGFVSHDTYNRIRSYQWNDPEGNHPDLNFYTLLPEDENSGDEKAQDQPRDRTDEADLTRKVVDWIEDQSRRSSEIPFVYEPQNADVHGDLYVQGNRRLGDLRRYILVTVSDVPPVNSYVSHFDRGQWFSIAADDQISQKNFQLLTLFLTMMAAPSATPPLSPSISVGGM
jgi:hypothetical protein